MAQPHSLAKQSNFIWGKILRFGARFSLKVLFSKEEKNVKKKGRKGGKEKRKHTMVL